MTNNRRLTVSVKREPAMTATRIIIGRKKLVYVLVATDGFNMNLGSLALPA